MLVKERRGRKMKKLICRFGPNDDGDNDGCEHDDYGADSDADSTSSDSD